MAENGTTNDKNATAEPVGRISGVLEAASVAEAMVAFNIARKSVLIYPLDHDQVKKTTQKAFFTLQQLLSSQPELSLTVLKDSLTFGGKILEVKSAALTELSEAFRQLELAAVTFTRGLEEKELISFLKWLVQDTTPQSGDGGIKRVDDKSLFRNIRTQYLDYSRLKVTEESEIQKKAKNENDKSDWQRFVSSLMDGRTEDDSLMADVMLDPVVLAGFFNKNEVDPKKAVAHYDHLIGEKLTPTEHESSDVQLSDTGLRFFNELIHELNPELRQQFLEVTFQRCSRHSSKKEAAQLIKGLGREVSLEMLRYAKADGKQISPSLLHLIQQIGHLPGAGPVANAHVSTENVQKLLSREAYEHYVDGDYDQILKQASIGFGDFPDLDGLVLDLESGLEERDIQCHTARALLRLMAVSADAADYRDWARQLTLVIPDLVDLHAYSCLSDIWDFVQEEHRRQQDQERFKVAGLVLKSFLQPRFISNLTASIENAGDNHAMEAMALLPRLGEPVVVDILDAMDGTETEADEQAKLRLLAPVSGMAAIEAAQRLNDERPAYVCLMLRTIRRFGDAQTADTVRLLLDHEDETIAREALATLAKHGNPWGLLRLRETITGPWSDAAQRAFEIAGTYRVRELVPVLVSFINKRGTLSGDSERRHAALRALGKIGDPACIPDLTQFAKKRKAFGTKTLAQLKKTLFESLDGFAFSDVEHLVYAGLKLKDPDIEVICRRLLKSHYDKSHVS